MKTYFLSSLLFFSLAAGTRAQSVRYLVSNLSERPLSSETLRKAERLSDLVPDYPEGWIDEYVSVEIRGTRNGQTRMASGENSLLNADQKSLLRAAEPADELVLDVHYKTRNVVTLNTVKSDMHIVFNVVPETQAAFAGGEKALNAYLDGKGIARLAEKLPATDVRLGVRFTVDEHGRITDVHLTQPSGNERLNRALLDAVREMPRWSPARNGEGRAVKQEFEFRAGRWSEGC